MLYFYFYIEFSVNLLDLIILFYIIIILLGFLDYRKFGTIG